MARTQLALSPMPPAPLYPSIQVPRPPAPKVLKKLCALKEVKGPNLDAFAALGTALQQRALAAILPEVSSRRECKNVKIQVIQIEHLIYDQVGEPVIQLTTLPDCISTPVGVLRTDTLSSGQPVGATATAAARDRGEG